MLGSILLGLLCAAGILSIVLILGMWANWFSIRDTPDVFSLQVLRMEPDGVEEIIPTEDGTLIRALHKGSGPPVLLLHDAGMSVVSMNLMWKLLAGSGFRVIAYDQRGHGKSTVGKKGLRVGQMVEDLRQVMDHFQLQDAILVGHSSGAFLTIRYLLQYQEEAAGRVKGVVSVAGFAGNILEGAQHNRFERGLIQTGIMGRLLSNRLFSWGRAASVFGAGASPSGVRAWLELFREKPLKRLLPLLNAQVEENYYSRLHEIQIPCIVAAGQADKRISAFHAQQLVAGLPNASLEWIDEAGNMLPWECPGKLVEMVRLLSKNRKPPA